MSVVCNAGALRPTARNRTNVVSDPLPRRERVATGVTTTVSVPVVDARARKTLIAVAVSYLVVIGFNAAVWLLVLEALSVVLAFELSNAMRFNVAVVLIGVLSITWALLRRLFGRQATL